MRLSRKKKKYMSLAVLLILVTFIGCSKDKDLLKMPNEKPGMLFKVKGTEAYLYGTQHIADKSSFPLNEKIEGALKSSDIFLSELGENIDNKNMIDINKYKYNDGDNIYNHVSEEGKEVIDKAMKEFGVTEDYLNYTPYVFNSIIVINYFSKYKINPSNSIDLYLTKLARKENKEIIALDPVEKFDKVIQEFSDKDNEEMFIKSLGDPEKMINIMDEGLKKIAEGDEEYFSDSRLNTKNTLSEKAYNAFVLTRDKENTEIIEKYINNGDKVFVAVGANHLAGEGSIVNILRNKGYEVEKVTDN